MWSTVQSQNRTGCSLQQYFTGWPIESLLPTRTLSSFSTVLLSSRSGPSLCWYMSLFFPRCTILLLPSLNFSQSIPPASPGPPEGPHSTLGYWSLLPALHHQKPCWGDICPTIQVIDESVKLYWVQYWIMGVSISDRPLTTPWSWSYLDCDPLGMPIQSVLIHLIVHSSCPQFLSLPVKILWEMF